MVSLTVYAPAFVQLSVRTICCCRRERGAERQPRMNGRVDKVREKPEKKPRKLDSISNNLLSR